MVINLDILSIFQQQFGFTPSGWDSFTDNQQNVNSGTDYPTVQSFNNLTDDKLKSSRGTPLYDLDLFGRPFFMPVYIGTDDNSLISLPYPVVSVNARKTMIETPLTDRNGTVKEIINLADIRFSIRGLIIGKDAWPEDQINTLNNLFIQQQNLSIKSGITDIFLLAAGRNGNDKVVISDMRWLPGKGDIKVRAYEMELLSDENFSLEQI